MGIQKFEPEIPAEFPSMETRMPTGRRKINVRKSGMQSTLPARRLRYREFGFPGLFRYAGIVKNPDELF
jgi:hypothetical protein